MKPSCQWCDKPGLFTVHDWLLCAQCFILHTAFHGCGVLSQLSGE